ncbi:MAG: hypothetical protein Kow0063_18550 [Anaerolineae bacterium]
MIAPILGGLIGAAIFAFILYTGWQRTVTRWRETGDPLQRAAQVVVAIISNLGLLLLLAAGSAALATFVVHRQDAPLLIALAAIGLGLFVGSFVLGFVLALFITGMGAASPAPRRHSPAKRKRKKRR